MQPVNLFIVLTRVFSNPKFSTEQSKSLGSALVTSSGVGHFSRNVWIFGIASFAGNIKKFIKKSVIQISKYQELKNFMTLILLWK